MGPPPRYIDTGESILRSSRLSAARRWRGRSLLARWARRFAAAASLTLAASAGATDDRDLTVDLEMGVLDADPVLDRLLTEAPQPWPGPRDEQPFDQQPPGVQDDPGQGNP